MRYGLRRQLKQIRKERQEKERLKAEQRKPKRYVTAEEHYTRRERYKKLAKVSLAGAILSSAVMVSPFIYKWYVANHPPEPSAAYSSKLENLTKMEKIANHPPKSNSEYSEKLGGLAIRDGLKELEIKQLEEIMKNERKALFEMKEETIEQTRKELSEMNKDLEAQIEKYQKKLKKADDLQTKGVSYGGLGLIASMFMYVYAASKK